MSEASLIYEKKGNIAFITLNRPQAKNIITAEFASELKDTCRKVKQDDSIRVVILTAAGDTYFCAGSDPEKLSHTLTLTPVGMKEFTASVTVSRDIGSIACPVIAAVNGDAVGQGLELALSCDIRIASDKAHFGFPQTGQAVIPRDGGTQHLPRIVGKGKALELLFTGDIIDAQEALRIGLVNRVVGALDLLRQAEELAEKIAAKGPVAVRYAKEAVNKGLDLTLDQGLRLEADLYFLLFATEDRTEGIKAFLAKRPPQFKGR